MMLVFWDGTSKHEEPAIPEPGFFGKGWWRAAMFFLCSLLLVSGIGYLEWWLSFRK